MGTYLISNARSWNNCRYFLFIYFYFIVIHTVYETYTATYYISKLVRARRLVNLAGRTLLHGPPNCCVIYHEIFSTYEANNSLKLCFTVNSVLKRANDLKRFQIDSFCFRPGSEIWSRSSWMEIVAEAVRHTLNTDIINILLTPSSPSVQLRILVFSPTIFALGP